MAETPESYITRRMNGRHPDHISTLKKLRRAQRKAKYIKAGILDGDDRMIDLFNQEVYMAADDNKNISHYLTLHPTKGFKKRSKKRDIFIEVASKAHMWKIIQHNMSRHTKGLKDEIIHFKHKA